MSMKPREQWGSRAGFVLAAIGGAIGLGNVWKFPYVTGRYGGASFLIVYAVALLLVALPVIMVEFAAGRRTQKNYVGALRELIPGTRWYLLGIVGVFAFVLICSFYFGIAGWTVAYFVKSISGSYAGATPPQIAAEFNAFLHRPAELLSWLLLFTIITGFVVDRGIRNGIEKTCLYLLPALFVVIAGLALWAILLPGAQEGLKFYLSPDWSKLSAEAVLAAIGQAFFTLGVGCGGMVIYGSYLDRKHTIASNAITIVVGDFSAAFLIGLLIFPAAFAFGINPEVAGPPLVFLTLPSVFVQMPFGMLFAALFYLALIFACLTSTMALLEAIVGYVIDEWGWQRRPAVAVMCTAIFLLGCGQMLSFGPWSGQLMFEKTFFELSDALVTTLLLPICALLTLILAGWIWWRALWQEFNTGEGIEVGPLFQICIRYIAPMAVAAILVHGLWPPGNT